MVVGSTTLIVAAPALAQVAAQQLKTDGAARVLYVVDTAQLQGQLALHRPDVIVSLGAVPGILLRSHYGVRRRWLHFDDLAGIDLWEKIDVCYRENLWRPYSDANNPLISVFTPTFNSGDFLQEAFASLRDQTYTYWEWVIVDDMSDDTTWRTIQDLAAQEPRIRAFRTATPVRKIGAMKDMCTRLARGEFLVELDHDDLLHETALDKIRAAFADPLVGFVYSHCARFFESGRPHQFMAQQPDGTWVVDPWWATRYRPITWRGREYLECVQPNIYDRFGPQPEQQFAYFLTVGPDHVRAFRACDLRRLGGYNPELPVADDWDLFVRFFLRSRCVLIPECLYFYRFRDQGGNATCKLNPAIQTHLAFGQQHYYAEFARFNAERLNTASLLSPVATGPNLVPVGAAPNAVDDDDSGAIDT